ncbi:MAG: diphthine synthase [Candidatus Bathycorpusculaceae bacterium]
MGEVVFVGLGLHDEFGISLRGLEEVKGANAVFIELYTSLLPKFSRERFEEISGKKLNVVSRRDLEEENGRIVFEAAREGKVVLLVPGDPLVATTHVALRLEAERLGIKTRVIHGASIISAVVGLSGLHNYKFGKSVTIPFPEETKPLTPYNVIDKNRQMGLHTLCLLDIRAEEERYLSIREALESLLETEEEQKRGIVTLDTFAVGIARAGSDAPIVKASRVNELLSYDFGEPPYSLIFPAKLHFMEAEALIAFADASQKIREAVE